MKSTASRLSKELISSHQRLFQEKGDSALLLWVFGDFLAQREGYQGLDGLEAVQLYLVLKHHWLPRDVRNMSEEDLRFALHVELQQWTLPEDVRAALGK